MENKVSLNKSYEAIAWGALLIWWGITVLIPSLPDGTGLIGVGLILLGVNGARYFNGIAISWFSAAIGILALVWGGLELAGAVLSLPFELPVFAILLIVLGVIVFAGQLTGIKNK